MCYKIVYQDETEQYTEAFDADDPTQVDRYPTYQIDTDLGELPPTPTQQRQQRHLCAQFR
jgi:hypothetical protein